MTSKQKRALAQHFTPPPPTRKEDFLAALPRESTTYGQVFLAQVGYVRKWIWALYLVCMALGLLVAHRAAEPTLLVSSLSAIVPLLSLCTVSELYRSVAHRMDELELSCRYNLTRILLMRLSILSMVNFLVLLFFLLLAGQSQFGLVRNLLYLGVPALLSMNGSLLLLSRLNTRDTLYPCAAVSTGVSLLTFIADKEVVFSMAHLGFWAMGFALLLAIMVQNLLKLKTNMEELQWNFA